MPKYYSDCYFHYEGKCYRKKHKNFEKKCNNCKDYVDIPKSRHDIQIKELKNVFRIVLDELRKKGYIDGGGNGIDFEIFSKPEIKMYIRDIKELDNEPYIIIRHH